LQSTNNARAIANELGTDRNLTFVGHSWAGLLAAANSLVTGDDAVTFNAAGLSAKTKTTFELNNTTGTIKAFVVEGEVVDRMQSIIGLKADGNIIYIPDSQGNAREYFENMSPAYKGYRSIIKHTIGKTRELLQIMELKKAKSEKIKKRLSGLKF